MADTFTVFIDDDGVTCGLKSPVTEVLGLRDRKRVSHIEPVNCVLRWLFHQIRKRCSDDSYCAAFTRYWPCRWRANIFSGPTLGPFRIRQKAIDAEVEWINKSLERGTDVNVTELESGRIDCTGETG